jgi:hypothetical protein
MVIGAVRVAIGRMAVSRCRQKSFPVEHAVNIDIFKQLLSGEPFHLIDI